MRVALGRASHKDTKTRRQETSRRGFALWERRGPPRPPCSAMPTENWSPLATRHISSTHSIHALSWRSSSRSPVLAKASHRATKTQRKVPAHRAAVALFALFSALPPSLPLMSSFGLPSAGYPASARWHVFSISAFSFVPHVCRIQTHRSRPGYRHGFERALDYTFGVVSCG